MKEILITSSVLILAVIALRFLFQSKVSRRLIYCAWLLVALRLLVPVQLGNVNFSVLTPAQPVTDAIGQVAQKPVAGPSREEAYNNALQDYITQERPIFVPEVQEQVDTQIQQSGRPPQEVYEELLGSQKPENVLLPEVNQQIESKVDETVAPTLGQIATAVWVIGMVAMAGWFIAVNLSFRRKLKESATVLELPECKIPVKVSSAVASPCLFGLLRPTIYLTPVCVGDEKMQHHVLTHELAHLRSGDHIWAWVRCICLCVYWFNPLVWVAASLSRRDCELACDEAVLKQLGETERLAYGKTLLDMVSSVPAPGQLLETATAMHETKKQLKERMKCIVKKQKVFLTAAIILLMVLAVITGCTFSGAFNSPQGDDPQTTTPSITTTPPTTTTVEDPTALDELKRLAAEADEMMREGGIYSFPFPWFWERATDPSKTNGHIDREGDTLIINTDMSKVDYGMVGYESFYKGVRYDLFLGLLSQEYGDCITEGECDYKPEYSHVQSYYVFFCPTYKEEGFSTIKECWDAVRKGQHTLRSEAYLIDYGYYRPFIQDFQDTDYNAKLHDAIFPPVGDPPADLVPLSFPVRDTMRRLATKATRMMEDKNRVTIPDNSISFFSDALEPYVTRQDGVIHVDTNVDPENQKGVYKSLRFLLFFSLVVEEYEDCVAEDESTNLLLYPGYKEAGFATIEDCLTAWKNGEFVFTGEAYSIGYYTEQIIMHHYIDLVNFDITQFVMKGIETGEDNKTDPTEPTTPAAGVAEIQGLLGYKTARNPYYYALLREFSDPREIELRYFFKDGFGEGDQPTDAEMAVLKEHYSDYMITNGRFFRLPKDRMNEELQRYFGITLADLPDSAFMRVVYLESSDSYGFLDDTPNMRPDDITVVQVEYRSDGTIRVDYTGVVDGKCVVILKADGDHYRILSNEWYVYDDPLMAEIAELFEPIPITDPGRRSYFWATGHTYTNPLELSLYAFYDGGFQGEHEMTEAEREALKQIVLWTDWVDMADFNRLPKDKMDAELQKVFGITLADLPDSAFERLYYLESTDCYYLLQTGMTCTPSGTFTSATANDDGTVTLTYNLPGGSGAITLKPNGNSWLVVSNIQDMLYG